MVEMLALGARAAAGDAAALTLARQVRPATHRGDIGPQRWQVTQVLVALIDHDLASGRRRAQHRRRPAPARRGRLAAAAVARRLGVAAGRERRRRGRAPGAHVRRDAGGAPTAAPSPTPTRSWPGGPAGRAEAAALLAAGDGELAGVPWWRRLLHTVVLRCAVTDGWGDPVPALRADLAAHEEAGDAALARTCRDLLRRAGAPPRAPAAARSRRACARSA